MNNDDKKILDGQEKSEVQSTDGNVSKESKNESKSFASWWKNLGAVVKAAIIAGASLVVIVPIVLAVLLSGGNGGPNDDDDDNEGGQSNTNASYSVTVVTKGGMAMTELPIYIYEYEDGALGDMVEGAYAATDASGKATFSLPKGGSYAAKIDLSMPDGYDVESHYPLVSANMTITVSSSVIPETSLVGVSYTLGNVMRDFTVTTSDGKKFTLSEVLKEKDAVLLNFWYTTCSWCITEFPYMQTAYEKYSDDIAIIALDPYTDPQTGDTLDEIKLFKSDMGLTFDMAQDFAGLASAFGVTGYPTSVMVDRYGVITLIEPGAIPSERAFDLMFEYFTADNYKQKLVYDVNDLVPQEKPNVDMPSSEDISNVFDGGNIPDVEYLPYRDSASDDEKEYSWPFIISELDDGTQIIHPSNANKESSFAQLIINVPLKAGDVLAFDYFASTELGVDVLYVVVDGKDIYSISGESDEWETCFAFVAEEDATYEVGLAYTKDSGDNVGDDTVYLKDLRVVGIDDIDRETYIYRFAATNPDAYSNYQDYAPIFYNSTDGYYHVDSVNGPILLADLMGYTRFSDVDYVYNMCLGKEYEAALTRYCNYASNAQLYGLCPVNEELKGLLIRISADFGDANNENEWLKLCCYYDAYGTDGKQLEDPIKGLALFAAYDVILSDKGDTDFPNSVTYNRVIMPRGLFSKFTPAQSGTYLITSSSEDESNPGTFIETDGWIFTSEGFDQKSAWYTYESVDRFNTSDVNNCYMIVYLEEGRDYYINIAYSDIYQEGTIDFRVERLGGEGYYRFSIASPGYFSSLESITGELTETISGGIDVELGSDGIWREKRPDSIPGSILYADFTNATPIFSHSIERMIELGGFNLSTTEGDEYVKSMLVSESAYEFYLKLCLADLWGAEYDSKYEEYKVDEVLDGIYHGEEDADGNAAKSENDEFILGLYESMATDTDYNNGDNFKAFLKDYWGADYTELLETYKVDDVLAGRYHGGGEDYTDLARSFLEKRIVAGYNEQLGETIAEDDARIGCVVVTDELASLLQILMDKYTFEGVENSWAKLCYYTQYFCAATPK